MKYFEMDGFPLYAALAVIAGYLLGSISFSVIASKLIAKDDVRNHGSGNAGFTNIMRNYGKLPSAVTLIGDFSKGVAAVLIGGLLLSKVSPDLKLLGEVIGGISVFIGHVFRFSSASGEQVCSPARSGPDSRLQDFLNLSRRLRTYCFYFENRFPRLNRRGDSAAHTRLCILQRRQHTHNTACLFRNRVPHGASTPDRI